MTDTTQSEPELSHGEVAYLAYAKSTGGFTYDGRKMPVWDALPSNIREAWACAAAAARRALL